jgi:autotransporter-associated beta strand protein
MRTPLLAGCLKKHEQNLFGFEGASAMKQRGSFGLIMAALILTAGYNAHSQTTFVWNNTGSNYFSTNSWTNNAAPSGDSSATTNSVLFSNIAVGNNTVSLTNISTVQTILFSSNANTYTFVQSGAPTNYLSVTVGITNSSTATQTFNLNVAIKSNSIWYQSAGGSMVFNTSVRTASPVTTTQTKSLTLTGGGTFDFKASMTHEGPTYSGVGGSLIVSNPGGTVNLSASNTLGGGVAVSGGTVNFYNAGSLGQGLLELNNSAIGTNYGNSILNNASGATLTLTGITGVKWTSTGTNAGIQIGTAASSATNNIDFGTGTVTTTTNASMNIAGTGVTISMGTLTTTGTGSGYTNRFDGAGNTIDLDGWKIGTSGTANVVHQINGSANVNVGAIENGTVGRTNGVEFNSSGVTRLTGNNTYTGTTSFQSGTNIVSGDNSAAVGNVTISGSKTIVRLENISAISSSSSLLGANATAANASTLDFRAAGDFTFNSFGTGDSSSATAGGSMAFTNSSGSQKTVRFTNANNYITALAAANRGLVNNSSNMTVDFDGNVTIGGTNSSTNITSFEGAGNFNVDGNLVMSTGATAVRNLEKKGAGTLTLQGASNNYTGSTLVSGGTLEVGAEGTLPTNSAVTVSTGARLRFLKTSGGINLTNLTVASGGTLEQNLITITSSGAVNLTGSTLKVNGIPTLASYTLVSGTSLTGTPPNLNSISDYALRISGNNLLLEKVVTDAYALYLSNNNLPAGTAFNAIIDGVTVGLKYAFASANGMPQNNGEAAVPVMSGNQLTYIFDVKDDSALTVKYQTSTDLVTWTTAQDLSPGTGAAPNSFLKKQVQVTGSDRLFIRLNVTR